MRQSYKKVNNGARILLKKYLKMLKYLILTCNL